MHREGHLGVAVAFYTPLGAIAYAAGFQQVALGGVVLVPDVGRGSDGEQLDPAIIRSFVGRPH